MSATVINKLSKSERKLQKKCNKSRSTLLKHEGIESVSSPSKILCVSNAGLDNHVTQDEVFDLFGCHGNVCEVIMLPRKPYAIVCFLCEEEAEAAYNALNGYKLEATEERKETITLYISYVRQAPSCIQPSTTLPPGLILLGNFITDEYADEIIASINWDTGVKDQERALKHRKVKHYGYEFKYSINNVDPDDPLPEGIPPVYKKLLDQALETRHVQFYPDQLTINQYQPGQGIPPHVDTTSAFEDGLMSLSIGSQVNMEFRHPDGQLLSILLPPNSLLIMTGESRYVWSHGITPRKYDIVPAAGGGLTLSKRDVRTSFTFRKITGVNPDQSVGKNERQDKPISNSEAAELEKQHVHEVYEEIASNFSGTRHTPWPNIVKFLQEQEPGSLLADFGCGNGKYFGINKKLYEVGSDRSFNLAEICKDRKFEVFVGDVLSIPLRADTFDVCLCIAVIHHLATEERRLKAVHELVKILRLGGKALIYVWAMEQELNKVKSKYLRNVKDHCVTESKNVLTPQETDTKLREDCYKQSSCNFASVSTYEKDNQSTEEAHEGGICEGQKVSGTVTGQGQCSVELLRDKFCDTGISERKHTGTSADIKNYVSKQSISNTKAICEEEVDNFLKGQGDVKTLENASTSDRDSKVLNVPLDKDSSDKIHENKFKVDETEKASSKIKFSDNSEKDMNEKLDSSASKVKYKEIGSKNTEGIEQKENMHEKLSISASEDTDKEIDTKNTEGAGVGQDESYKSKLQVHVNRTEFKQQDLLVPWQLKGKSKPKEVGSDINTFHRFYHVFKKGELEELCAKISHCKVIHSYYDQGNWAVILEKI